MGTLVMQYGLLPPTTNAALVNEQMVLAHRYRNTLTEIERARRAALREAMRDAEVERLEGEAATAAAEVKRLDGAIKQLRKEKRGRVELAPDREALRKARARKWEIQRQLSEARSKARKNTPEITRLCDDINERAGELRVGARGLSGVYWGTYQRIEAAERASRGMPLYKDGEPNDPQFVRWHGDGSIGVRIQKTILLAEHLQGGSRSEALDPEEDLPLDGDGDGDDDQEGDPDAKAPALSMLRFGPIDARLHTERRRRRAVLTTFSIRVGSMPDRKPIWAEFPIKLHRPLPQGSRIIAAEVSRRLEGPQVSDRLGPRARWVVNITVDVPPRKTNPNEEPKEAAVAVNVGWRVIPEGLRVLTWRGSDGASGTLVLPTPSLQRMRSVQELQSIRRTSFNQAVLALHGWIQRRTSLSLPSWFVEATKTIAQWKSYDRLTKLAFAWMHRRFDGDAEGYDAIAAWRYNDHHLGQFEHGRRRRVQNHRRDLVRCLASELARRYKTLLHDDTDLRAFQVLPEMGAPAERDSDANNKTARGNRVRSAASHSREWLAHAFTREGGELLKLPSQNKTRECHVCHQVEKIADTAASIHITCSSCGTTWDQDDNHVRVLLQHWREQAGAAPPPGIAREDENPSGPAEKRETSLQRGKRIKKEKKAAREAARETTLSAT